MESQEYYKVNVTRAFMYKGKWSTPPKSGALFVIERHGQCLDVKVKTTGLTKCIKCGHQNYIQIRNVLAMGKVLDAAFVILCEMQKVKFYTPYNTGNNLSNSEEHINAIITGRKNLKEQGYKLYYPKKRDVGELKLRIKRREKEKRKTILEMSKEEEKGE